MSKVVLGYLFSNHIILLVSDIVLFVHSIYFILVNLSDSRSMVLDVSVHKGRDGSRPPILVDRLLRIREMCLCPRFNWTDIL